MLRKKRYARVTEQAAHAAVFAALGDETRLLLITKLCKEQPRSIAQLTEGSKLTRQAITKHLKILEHAGIVRSVRKSRENLFELEKDSIKKLKEYLEFISEQWDQSLARLKSFVEK